MLARVPLSALLVVESQIPLWDEPREQTQLQSLMSSNRSVGNDTPLPDQSHMINALNIGQRHRQTVANSPFLSMVSPRSVFPTELVKQPKVVLDDSSVKSRDTLFPDQILMAKSARKEQVHQQIRAYQQNHDKTASGNED